MSKQADPTGSETEPTEVESAPHLGMAEDLTVGSLAEDTAVEAPPVGTVDSSEGTVPLARPRPVPDRSEFLAIGDDSTPGGSRSRSTSSGQNSVRKLIAGLRWRRPDPVIERASSEGAEAARHYALHDLAAGESTPPPVDSVLVRTTVERGGVRISVAQEAGRPRAPSETTEDIVRPGVRTSRRRFVLFGALGVVAMLLLGVIRAFTSASTSAPRPMPSASASAAARAIEAHVNLVPVAAPVLSPGIAATVPVTEKRPSTRPSPIEPSRARPAASAMANGKKGQYLIEF